MNERAIRDALRRATAMGGSEDAAALVARAAAAARADPALIALAVEATLEESQLLSWLGQDDLALARATWAIAAAQSPAHRARLGEPDVAREVTLAFIVWCSAAEDDERFDVDSVLRVLDAGERFIESIGRPEWRCGLLAERASCFKSWGRYAEGIDLFREAIAGKQRCPDAPMRAFFYVRLGLGESLSKVGRHEEAAAELRSLLLEPHLDRNDRFGALDDLGHNALARGAHEEAVRCAEEAIQLAAGLSRPQQACAHGLAVEAYLAVDRPADARRSAALVMDLGQWLGTTKAIFNGHQDLFDVCMYDGDLAAARHHLAEMERLAARLDGRNKSDKWGSLVRPRRARLAAADPDR